LITIFPISRTHQFGMSREVLRCSERQKDAHDDTIAASTDLPEYGEIEDSLSQGSFSNTSDDACIFPDCQVEQGELPSIGSQYHSKGTCRPCSFFPHRKCRVGKMCKYCHFPHAKLFKNSVGEGIGEVERTSQKDLACREGANIGSCKISL